MLEKNVWVVVPAHNEAKTIKQVIDKIKEFTQNVVVVVDGSVDNTLKIADEQEINVLHHIVNLGKGSALKTGCDFAINKGANKLVAIDADMQHDPSEIPNFIRYLDDYDVILGYREINKDMPFVFRIGNIIINYMTKVLYNIDVKDTQCGYRAFTTNAYQRIRWESSDYFMESEMIANIGKANLRYKEIPIKTIYSDRYKGTTVIDGVKIVINLFWLRLARKRL